MTTLQFIAVSTNQHMMFVESLAGEIWTEHYTPIIGSEQVEYMLDRFQSRQAISEQIRTGVLYFLMRKDIDFIGYLAVEPGDRELFLSKIYVRAPERGKGFGAKALAFAEQLARERNLPRIVLTVNKNNTSSIKAYEKCGYRNVGALIQDIGNGFVMDDYRFEKTLPGHMTNNL